MKSINEYFNFPIRVYDRVSVTGLERDHKAFYEGTSLLEEEIEKLRVEPSWVKGHARIPVDEIKGIVDGLSLDQDVKEVAQNGFKFTVVMTRSLGDFMCTWNKTRFELELDKHLDTLSKS